MAGTKIICIGSPFGDDQFGAWAYEQLFPLIDPNAAKLLYLDRPGTRLIAELEEVDNLILIDAVKSSAPIGSVLRIKGAAIYQHLARHTSTHGFGIADALQLAERLGQLPPKILLIGIAVGKTDTLAPLSSQVRSSLPTLMDELHDYFLQRTCRLG